MVTHMPIHSMLDRMLTLSRAMDSRFEQGESEIPVWKAAGRVSTWFPPVDTYETDSAFVLEMDVPGVHPENVELSFEQNTLTIKGMRAPTIKAPENGELRVFTSERASGEFVRVIRLPAYVDAEKITANYVNGVLAVTIPKSAAAKPRKIVVGGGA